MDVSSGLPYKRRVPWHGLLLTASLLTCWHLLTTAEVSIELLPPQLAAGDDVLLQVHNLPENIIAFVWYKEVENTSLGIAVYSLIYNVSVLRPEHSGRGTLYRDGSLRLQTVTEEDTGLYTLKTITRDGHIVSTATIHLQVYAFLWICGRFLYYSQPSIEPVPPRVAEGEDILLIAHNLPEDVHSFGWYRGKRMSGDLEVVRHIIATNSTKWGPACSGRETVYGNGSLLLRNVTREDSGLYMLRFLRPHNHIECAHGQVEVDTSLSRITIEPVPRYAAEGESVLLLAHNLPDDLQAFSWYKSVYWSAVFKIADHSRASNSTTWGLAHNRKEIVYTNGSLLLQNVTEKDAGVYTLRTFDRDSKTELTHVQFHVNKPVTQPFIRVPDTTVTVQSSTVLSCISADTGISIRWIFNKRTLQLTDRMMLSQKKHRLHIDPIRPEDAGEYQCEVYNLVSSKTSLPVSLTVMDE